MEGEKLDRAHTLAAALDESSSYEEVLATLAAYREACWPDALPLSEGTIAWFMASFLPKWIERLRSAALERAFLDAYEGQR